MSYINNVDGSIDVTNAIGAIESIVTNGNATTVSATAQAKISNVSGKLGVAQMIENNYNNLSNKPSINGVELIENKTTEDLGIVGTSMTEIELSTDIANPTEIINFINKSGTYVAKNLGVIGTNGEAVTALAKGQFFTVSNLQEYAKSFGLEIPDDENIIDIDARTPDGIHITYRIIGGRQVQEIVRKK